MIQLQQISKRFGPLQALDSVSLSIPPGQILGLLGENGAGKSTLTSILFGLIRADTGSILVQDTPVHIRSPRAAQALGIGMVHQHFKLVPTLTGIENLRLFLHARAVILRAEAAALLERLRWSVPLDQPVESLAVGQQQRIEILKALLALDAAKRADPALHSTLILDEPTAVLTPQETTELFTALLALKDTGAAIVFISHKLNEVQKLCDHIAILRRGKLVHDGPLAAISPEQIAEKMVGAKVEIPRLPAKNQNVDNKASAQLPLLELRNIATSTLHSLSLSLRPGEILGIAGVDGNGQSHLVQTILGILPLSSGEILLRNQNAIRHSTRDRLDRIAFIAEDRHKEALVLPLSIQSNLMLKDYRSRRFNTLGWLRFRAWRSHAKELMHQFDIRANSAAETAGRLSGGNQQKVVLARELYSADKPIILAANPTRGLDVGATAFVMQKLLDARARGAGILLIHSDLDELLAISDRVSVLYNGALIPTSWPDSTKEQIGQLMLGLAAH